MQRCRLHIREKSEKSVGSGVEEKGKFIVIYG